MSNTNTSTSEIRRNNSIRWLLVFYDAVIYLVICLLLLFYNGRNDFSLDQRWIHFVLGLLLITASRILWGVYKQIWRYGGVESYLRLFVSDGTVIVVYYLIQFVLPIQQMPIARIVAIVCMSLLGSLAIRMVYRYIYKSYDNDSKLGILFYRILNVFGASGIDARNVEGFHKINIAIVGAGRQGVALAEDISNAKKSPYNPVLFIDRDIEKVGRSIHRLPVISSKSISNDMMSKYDVQEVVIVIPDMSVEDKQKIYKTYKDLGIKVKVYDSPMMEIVGKKRIREIDPEELLFRRARVVWSGKTVNYYKDKVILITGGGGSIGSEICRQLATMGPKCLIIFDVYENGAYDIQQELQSTYHDEVKVNVEIASICGKAALTRVFEEYHPQIVVMAAAHKHVPLMEKNCIEAVHNNVFGTLNTIEVSEQFNVDRVIMVSTDKAVNPTNIMGATKRMCEMMALAFAKRNKAENKHTTYSITRFGNVLGSAGSVIPLFKKQIAQGGPITITDKRIIRYFMTIPEASQLVLQSGAMANNGELYVLDMGEPVRVLELAENMIQLSGSVGIEIVETGLRPGEKLYEELLVQSDNLEKTENDLIFIEKEEAESMEVIEEKLCSLRIACESGEDEIVRETMKIVVPTYKGKPLQK